MQVRGLKAALNSSGQYGYKKPDSIVDFLVVGGGVIGLSIAQRLAKRFPSRSTIVVERHGKAGQETSSRNSEVVHAGLYYPQHSLKTKLCIRGRRMLYEHCEKYSVPFRKVGKLVVAQEHQKPYIEKLHAKAQLISKAAHNDHLLPTTLISGDEARAYEPTLSQSIMAALWSPETGIVDSHAFMESLEMDIKESEGGELAYSTEVVRVDPHVGPSLAESAPADDAPEPGWVVQTVTGGSEESDAMLARILINASGLSGNLILNSMLPVDQHIPMYFARGSYASCNSPAVSGISHLIYPCPDTGGREQHAFQSLGTHLTIDLNGKVKFGPDIEWLNPGPDEDPGFWQHYLVPDGSKMEEMCRAIGDYLTGVTVESLQPDYCGIRPKQVGPTGGFQDFTFRVDRPWSMPGMSVSASPRGKGGSQMITLLGIESPGLTSSLAIAAMVVDDIICREVPAEK
ncbi:NAD dehydrogenase [Cristinia sonorae]|uniref:L-2-hydroxyglutarate dehydrogenase, mitochondrial n=1 Tax=Cristinia sonorae TaxID=1940300 RepID=A0A8K0UXK1_9AGAR|nr:NAD dehydrogenase [Cristinia sonorae]